jgi:hypothetical protein
MDRLEIGNYDILTFISRKCLGGNGLTIGFENGIAGDCDFGGGVGPKDRLRMT